MRLARLVPLIAVTAAALGPVAASPAAPAGSVYVALGGSDAAACTQSQPCKTLARGLQAVPPGGTIRVAPGRYPSETLAGGGAGTISFVPVSGRVVMGGRLTLAGVRNVRFVNFSFPRSDPQFELLLDACNSRVTFVGSTGRRFVILEGNAHIRFDGGSWGGYSRPGDEDSAIGTAGATGPERQCNGRPAAPAHDIVFDRFTFHDVFWGKTVAHWGGSHPDCFEINGYANGVTIRNSTFLRCQDSFFAIYTNQGDVVHVMVEGTTFRELGDTTWYGSQWSSGGGHHCGAILFRGNHWQPDNPKAHYPYSSIHAACVPPSGVAPVQIVGNTFQRGPVAQDCANEKAAPYFTVWRDNMFALGNPCRS